MLSHKVNSMADSEHEIFGAINKRLGKSARSSVETRFSQEAAIVGIKVKSAEELISPEILALAKGAPVGASMMETPGQPGMNLEMTVEKNGTVHVQVLEPIIGPAAIMLPSYLVREYYVLDKTTNKAWDASHLWSHIDADFMVAQSPGSSATFFTIAREGVVLYISNALRNPLVAGLNMVRKSLGRVGLDNVSPLMLAAHEAGHSHQFNHDRANPNDLNSLMNKSSIEVLTLQVLTSFYQFVQFIPNLKELLINTKATYRDLERNAHAFSLLVARELKRQGLDIHRGKTSREIMGSINAILATYEGVFMFVPGMPLTGANRKKARQK